MSEKKKKFVPFKDALPPRRPFVFKSDRDTAPKDPEKEKKLVEKEMQPTILIKPREPSAPKEENRPQSPKQHQSTDIESVTPSKIAQNESKEKKIIEQKNFAPLPPMIHCVKLLDDKFEINLAAGEFLHDSNSNYLVVGIIGYQGVGKSTILNILALDKPTDDLPLRILTSHEVAPSEVDQSGFEEQQEDLHFVNSDQRNTNSRAERYFKFKMQDMEQIEHAKHCTEGIDMYVTPDRVILLDTEALFSPSALEECSISGTTPVTVRGSTVATVECLQLAAYLMSVCHVLIVTQDWFTDHNFLRLIQTAEMLKPSVSSNPVASEGGEAGSGYGGGEQLPHLLLLHNRCQLEDYLPSNVKKMQDLYRQVFKDSKLQLNSGMYLYSDHNKNGPNVEALCRGMNPDTCGPPLNMFLLPEIYEDCDNTDIYRGHPPFHELAERLRWTVRGVSRHQIYGAPGTGEKAWFHHAAKTWEVVRKCNFFTEYGRLLP